MTHFIPCYKVDDACFITNLFFKEVVRLHRLLRSIVFYWDSEFLSHFWRTLWEKLGTKLLFSTTCQFQIDGKKKWLIELWVNFWDIWYTRIFKEWETHIPHIEFAYNKVVRATTSHSPFEIVYGFNPLTPLDLCPFPTPKRNYV